MPSVPIRSFQGRSLNPKRFSEGFTLLEVMIAMAMLALVFVTAFWSQSRAVELKNQARWNMVTGVLIQRFLSAFITFPPEELSQAFLDVGKENPGFGIRAEGGAEPFSDLKNLREFRIEIDGPIEGMTYKTKLLLYIGEHGK